MKSLSAYLLVIHGSRDPRPQVAVEQLAQFVSQKLQSGEWQQRDRQAYLKHMGLLPAPTADKSLTPSAAVMNAEVSLVGTACLELAPLSLHKQIEQFVKETNAAGFNRLQILPLFLLPGVHVMEDIPVEVGMARQALSSNLTLDIRPHLGAHPGLQQLLATQMKSVSADAWILLSHGSRRPGGNQPVELLAAQLGAVSAYWSVPPSIKMRVSELVNAGYRQIGILPYFLFAGGITDAIAQTVKLLSQEFPSTNFRLLAPLGASAELANLILDLTQE